MPGTVLGAKQTSENIGSVLKKLTSSGAEDTDSSP